MEKDVERDVLRLKGTANPGVVEAGYRNNRR